MGLWQRFKLIFASKANKALDKAEDPRETLDYSYEKQLELLQKVRRGVADVDHAAVGKGAAIVDADDHAVAVADIQGRPGGLGQGDLASG